MSLLDGKDYKMEYPPIWIKEKTESEEKVFPLDGCEFCMNNIFINEDTNEFEMIVETEWEHQNKPMGDFIMQINYCPECGLRLK